MAPQNADGETWEPGAPTPTAPAPAAPPAAPTPAPAAASSEEDDGSTPPPPPPPPQLVVDRAPGMPQPVDTDTTSISLQWAPVSCTVLSAVPVAVEYMLHYQLQMQQVDEKTGVIHPARWSVQYTGTASFVQVKGLRPGRRYAARVVAHPAVTNMPEVVVVPSPPSDVVAVETVPCAPMGQPAPVLASRTKKELKFKWNEPEETGGRVLEYVLEMSPAPEGWSGPPPSADGFHEMHRGAERSFLAKRLVPGVQYCARVKAANALGESAWSPLAVCYTQATVPSWAPSDAPFVWDTTPTSVTLGWPEPAANGGTVTGYEVEMDDGSGFRHVARSQECQCTVQGLRSGILYKFRVRAENEAGRSLWSPLGEGRTAAVAPGPCSTSTLMGSSQTSLSIRWEGPEDDGGSPVRSYRVEIRPKSAAAVQGLADEWLLAYQGTDTACTISNLRAGCVYMIRVCAVSQVGLGAFGATAMLQTAPGNPECPGVPVAAARQQTELTLTWAAPVHDGGSRITAYRLEMSCLGSTEGPGGNGSKGKSKVDPGFELAYLGPDRTAVVSDLEPGTRYSFRCSAVSEQGSSGWGPLMQAETLPGLPYEVDLLHLVAATATTVKLRWIQPFGRGARVTAYVLEMAPTSALQSARAAHAAQQQTEAAAAAVAAMTQHAAADGVQQAAPQPALPPPLPIAPQQPQQPAHHEQQHAQQQQHKEQHANGVQHSKRWDPDALFRPAYQGPDSACTVSGLEPNTSYTFRVRAVNAVGVSVSEVQEFTTAPAPPSPPLSLVLRQATPGALRVAWQPPLCDHGAAVTGYQLEWARGGRTAAVPAAAWRSGYQGPLTLAQVDGLEAGSRYQLRVRAGNSCGWGHWSEALACATSPDVPAAPAGLTAKAVGITVRAAWEASDDRGSPVTAYELEMAQGGGRGSGAFEVVAASDALSQRVQQLEPNTRYAFRVRAVNAVGRGLYSQEVIVQTSRAPPSPPTDVTAQLVLAEAGASSSSCLEVRWAVAQQGAEQAAVMAYEIEAAAAPSQGTVRHTCAARATSATVPGLHPGCTYTVRVRSVGADNAGHSEWARCTKEGGKEELRFKVPGPPPAQRANSAAVGDGAGAGSDSGAAPKAHKRRGAAAGSGQQAQRAAAATKTVAARAPPKKGWAQFAPLLRRYTGFSATKLLTVCIASLIVILALLFVFGR